MTTAEQQTGNKCTESETQQLAEGSVSETLGAKPKPQKAFPQNTKSSSTKDEQVYGEFMPPN